MTVISRSELIEAIQPIASRAGDEIMRYYRDGVTARTKADHTPVTEADEAAERLILSGLRALTPDIPAVAEESVAAGHVPRLDGGRFWLVDPLDGTKEFLSHTDEFTVNIGLIEDGAPVLGLIHVPAKSETYFATAPDAAFHRIGTAPPRPIRARVAPPDGVVVVTSRFHRDAETEAFLANVTVKSEAPAGSALKFGLVARGAADLYPRFGRTMEWDTAAGHAILAAAGGSVRCLDGSELTYSKPEFENPSFIARGREA